MTDLAFVLSHGFSARMVLHSGLLQALRANGVSVTVLLPEGQGAGIDPLAAELGFSVETLPRQSGRGGRVSALLRPYLFENVRHNAALWAKHLRGISGDSERKWVLRSFYALNRLATRNRTLRQGLIRWQRRELWSPAIAELLDRIGPRVVVSTYPVNDVEGAVLLAAQRGGILTVGQLLSWDNITCKGRWLVVPNRFLAWGPIMAEELKEYYSVNGDSVLPTGVPHFDAYATSQSSDGRSELLQSLGLRSDRPYLFFGMSSPVFAPTEIDVVEWLAGQVESGQFGAEMQLVVRPHPQNVEGAMADQSWLPRLEALRSGRVAIHRPRLVQGGLPWTTERGDLVDLANVVGGCSVCMNSGSTLSIDAIVAGRPVVLPLFDVGAERPWHLSVRRVADYPHLQKLLDLGGISVAADVPGLQTAILAYLANPRLHERGRQLVRERELGVCDGRASERAADALAAWVRGTDDGVSK